MVAGINLEARREDGLRMTPRLKKKLRAQKVKWTLIISFEP